MKVKVFDTHVKTKDGKYYHFDVLVENSTKEKVELYALEFLDSIGIKHTNIEQKACDLCHMELAELKTAKEIENKGYSIIKMEGF